MEETYSLYINDRAIDYSRVHASTWLLNTRAWYHCKCQPIPLGFHEMSSWLVCLSARFFCITARRFRFDVPASLSCNSHIVKLSLWCGNSKCVCPHGLIFEHFPMVDIQGRYRWYSYDVFDPYRPYILKHTIPPGRFSYILHPRHRTIVPYRQHTPYHIRCFSGTIPSAY